MTKRIPNIPFAQMYPSEGSDFNLNCCTDTDCGNFAVAANLFMPELRGAQSVSKKLDRQHHHPELTSGLGVYGTLPARGDAQVISRAFEYNNNRAAWGDGRHLICRHLRNNSECGNTIKVMSNQLADEEHERIAGHNGILAGPACGACGKRYLDAPDEFIFNGRHVSKSRKTNRRGTRPAAVRLIHRPCKGEQGARFSVSSDHIRQVETYDNIRILMELMSGAGLNDLRRVLRNPNTGKTVGASRIYDRIFWLEKTLLAYERAQLKIWHNRQAADTTERHTKVATDDLVLTINWETKQDRRTTPLHCTISADIDSGYVYRSDINFDPSIDPIEFFDAEYLDSNGQIDNIRNEYKQTSGVTFTAPKLAFQRPTGRFQEPQYFTSCQTQLRVFIEKLEAARLADPADRDTVCDIIENAKEKSALIGKLATGYFGIDVTSTDGRGSFNGALVSHTYTKAAHFRALRNQLPPGKLTITTDSDVTQGRVIPIIFSDMINRGQFEWLVTSFNKTAKKPEILKKTKEYKENFRAFRNGKIDEDVNLNTPIDIAYSTYIARFFSTAVNTDKAGRPAPASSRSFRLARYPSLWVSSPAQSAGEIDKLVGFPIVSQPLRETLKSYSFDQIIVDPVIRGEIGQRIESATLQPTSTFMNSVRERLSNIERAGGRGARVAESYINGAAYNPRVVIALINIFRVYYNYFETRPYVSTANMHAATEYTAPGTSSIKVPGSAQRISVKKRRRLKPILRTPAMRAGIHVVSDDNPNPSVPKLAKVLYQPWLFHGTPLWSKLVNR